MRSKRLLSRRSLRAFTAIRARPPPRPLRRRSKNSYRGPRESAKCVWFSFKLPTQKSSFVISAFLPEELFSVEIFDEARVLQFLDEAQVDVVFRVRLRRLGILLGHVL